MKNILKKSERKWHSYKKLLSLFIIVLTILIISIPSMVLGVTSFSGSNKSISPNPNDRQNGGLYDSTGWFLRQNYDVQYMITDKNTPWKRTSYIDRGYGTYFKPNASSSSWYWVDNGGRSMDGVTIYNPSITAIPDPNGGNYALVKFSVYNGNSYARRVVVGTECDIELDIDDNAPVKIITNNGKNIGFSSTNENCTGSFHRCEVEGGAYDYDYGMRFDFGEYYGDWEIGFDSNNKVVLNYFFSDIPDIVNNSLYVTSNTYWVGNWENRGYNLFTNHQANINSNTSHKGSSGNNGWTDTAFTATWTLDIPAYSTGYCCYVIAANYPNNSYTITYKPNGGSGAAYSRTGTWSQAISLENNYFTRTCYSFIGWGLGNNTTTVNYLPGQSFTLVENTVMNAIWQESHRGVYNKNKDGHWQECGDCGKKLSNSAAHVDGDYNGYCDTCGYQMIIYIAKPSGTLSVTYDGAVHTFTPTNFQADKMSIEGNSGTNAGDYTAVVRINNSSLYRWSDTLGYEAVSLPWKINRAVIQRPTGQGGSLTFNGGQQSPNIVGYNPATMGVTGNTGTDAGPYQATVTPGSNYMWPDGSIGDTLISWTINKKQVTVVWGNTEFTYNTQEQGPTASVASGVTGEAINLSVTRKIDAGEYVATAAMVSVTGGRGKTENYELLNTTRNFVIHKAPISPTVTMSGYEYGKTKKEPSINGNPGNGTVVFYYNTTNTSSGGKAWTTVANSTSIPAGAYYMYATVAETANYLGATTPAVKFIIGRPPIITITSNTTYSKSQTATITIYDPDKDLKDMDNDQYLLPGTITLYYEWTQSSTAPSKYTQSTTISVGNNVSSVQKEITKNTDSGIWYLHVKATVQDKVGYTSELKATGTFYLDNTAPTITMITNTTIQYIDKNDTCYIDLYVTDIHSETTQDQLTLSDINIYVAGAKANATAKLEHIKYDTVAKQRQYRLTLSKVSNAAGYITLSIPANAVTDNAGNKSAAATFGIDTIKIFVDNTIPVIALNGEISVRSITEGANLSGIIDNRYINKEYEIVIPILVTDVGTDVATNELEAKDITLKIGDQVITADKKVLEKDGTVTYVEVPVTRIRTYSRKYNLVLKGLKENGYLSFNIASGAVTDIVGNVNVAKEYVPYTNYVSANTKIYVDNVTPRVYIETDRNGAIREDEPVEFILRVIDTGAGIRAEEFKAEDIYPTINGTRVTVKTKKLTASTSNNYNTPLGGGSSANYTYTLVISGIPSEGTLRLELPKNVIVDKANNGLEVVTLSTNVTVDKRGPTIGRIETNADEYGRLVDEETKLRIDNCTDESGIKSYEWQVSTDGVKWETFYKEDSSLSSSEAQHQIEEDGLVYYKVIVEDKVGNKTESDVATVDFSKSLNRKPTVRYEITQNNSERVEVLITIKSTTQIEKVEINGVEIPKSTFNIDRMNYEVTTAFTYEATQNGTYDIKAIDENGNEATNTFNINTLNSTNAEIQYEIKNATAESNARIIFKSSEEVRIMDAKGYEKIEFSTEGFATIIEAVIEEGYEYPESVEFKFENRSFVTMKVTVNGPITTKSSYIRFTDGSSQDLNVTIKEAYEMASQIGKTQKSYYGIDNSSSMNTNLATKNELNVAKGLANAKAIYTRDSSGAKEKVEASEELSPETDSKYVNGNVTGMSETKAGLIDSEDQTNTDKYNTFRITITR